MSTVRNGMFRAALGAAISWSLATSGAMADESAKGLVGVWKLAAWTVQVVGESDRREPYGPNPKGRLVLTPEGYWIIVITGANRHPAKTMEDKAALLDSTLAYSGRYRVEGDKVTTRVEMSTNEIYTGANQDQVRFFKVDGDKLYLRTPEIASAVLVGKRVVGTITFDRER